MTADLALRKAALRYAQVVTAAEDAVVVGDVRDPDDGAGDTALVIAGARLEHAQTELHAAARAYATKHLVVRSKRAWKKRRTP